MDNQWNIYTYGYGFIYVSIPVLNLILSCAEFNLMAIQ